MSGVATFSGTSYQARVIAHVYVHILAQSRLGWLELFDDTPIGISGETDGPGDDARIEFGDRHLPVEVQAKHGLNAGAKLSKAIARVRHHRRTDIAEVVFVVDRTSSRTVHVEVARDLDRFRAGRTDGLRAEFERIAAELGSEKEVLQQIVIVTADLDATKDPERKLSIHLLEGILEDPSQAESAWAVLSTDADDLCARKLRRTRKDLVDLLAAAKIAVRLPGADERVNRQLDLSKRLIAEDRNSAVLPVLSILDAELKGRSDVDPLVRYRIAQHRSAALLALGRSGEALKNAQLALDIRPDGFHALLVSAQAAAELGTLRDAQRYVEQAVAVEPLNPDAWGVRAQIEVLSGREVPIPPAGVAEHSHYQVALAQIAHNAFNWQRVCDLTAAILATGSREPKVLQLRASALAGLAEKSGGSDADVLRGDAERLVTEAIEAVPDDSPLAGKLLILRAEIRRARGDEKGSDADLALAVDLDDDDADAIAHRVQAQLLAGRPEHALQMLQAADVAANPMLLVLRAQARAEVGDWAGAAQDLDAAASGASETWRPDTIRIYAAETALTLNDLTRAEMLLDAVTDSTLAPEMQATLRGRLAALRGDGNAAKEHFHGAVAHAPALRAQLLSELAQLLLRIGDTAGAIEVFQEVGVADLPDAVHQQYASALMQSHDLVRAKELIAVLGDPSTLPEWALSLAAELAARQGDTERALQLFQAMDVRRPGEPAIKYEIARRLLLLSEIAAAMPYLDALLTSVLSPQQRMALAHLLKEADRRDEAIREAFAAFRAAPQDPSMHRGFGGLIATDARPVMHPGVIGDETYVRLVSDDGDVREYIVYASGPVDPLRNEIPLESAATMGLVGKRTGDHVELYKGTWQASTWRVDEILPAIVYAFRDVVAKFEQRFPSEPFFVKVLKIPDADSVKFLLPIISTLQSKKERSEAIFKTYRENTLPLGFVAEILDARITDVMAGATSVEHELGPFAAEWSDLEGQHEAADVARTASTVVLTRSALETLQTLDLLDAIAESYTWWIPRSLKDAIRREIAEAERHVTEGHCTMAAAPTGLQLVEFDPGDARLRGRARRLKELASWVAAHTAQQYRPLAAIAAPDSPHEQLRGTIGHDSFDAVELAEHFSSALLADDLGLRRLLPKGSPGRSFSTITLLPRLAELGIVPQDRARDALLQLVQRRYTVIMPTRALLLHALNGTHASQVVASAFKLLGGPALDLASAARIAAETLKSIATAPLVVVTVREVTRQALEGLATRWSPPLAAYALLRAVAPQFVFLPTDLRVIREVATTFVQSWRAHT